MSNNYHTILETVLFTVIGSLVDKVDLHQLDANLLQPVQHFLSILSYALAIIVALPLAIKVLISFYKFLFNKQ